MSAMTDHRTAWELIPWYVNDTLEAAERRLVERHLAGCAECRAEVALCRGMVEAGGRPEALAPAPHPARLERLVARIVEEADAAEPDRAVAEDGEQVASDRRPWPPRDPRRTVPGVVRGAGRMAAAALVVLAAGAVGYLVALRSVPGPEPPPPAEYRTLSQPEAPPDLRPGDRSTRSAGTILRMVFAPEAQEREIRQILLAVHGVIVAGPSPLGVYSVRLDAPVERPDAEEPLPVVLDHLRREPLVLFVEPVETAGGAEPSP